MTNFASGGNLSSHDGALLSNGNYLLYKGSGFMILQPDGTELLAWTPIADCTGDVSIAPLDGKFVVGYRDCDNDDTLTLRPYDNEGAAGTFQAGAITELSRTLATDTLEVAATEAGFAVAWSVDSSTESRHLEQFDADGNSLGTPVGIVVEGLSNYMGLRQLAGDQLLWIFEEDTPALGDQTTYAAVYDATGVELMLHPLSGTYIGDHVAMARADDGSVIVAFEAGGPDALAYATFDGFGNLTAGPKTLTAWEPDEITVGVFGDGDFAVCSVEDDSGAVMMWNITHDGQLVHANPILFGDGWEADNRFSIFTAGDYSLTMIYDVYSDPGSYMIEVAKNYLKFEIVDDHEARVTNWGAAAVEVVISAAGDVQ